MERLQGPQHTAAMQPNTTFPAPLKVFLVEDSVMIRERLVTLLSPIEGLELTGFAEHSEQAVLQITAERPDAVVLDLNLASGSGLDVLREVRRAAPEVEIFVLTNFAVPQYRRLCTALGARGFFDKTTEFERVRDALAARASQPVHQQF